MPFAFNAWNRVRRNDGAKVLVESITPGEFLTVDQDTGLPTSAPGGSGGSVPDATPSVKGKTTVGSSGGAAAFDDVEDALASVVSGGGVYFFGSEAATRPKIDALPPGTEYRWDKTNGAGVLLDFKSGVA